MVLNWNIKEGTSMIKMIIAMEEEDGCNLKEEHKSMIDQDIALIQEGDLIMIKDEGNHTLHLTIICQ